MQSYNLENTVQLKNESVIHEWFACECVFIITFIAFFVWRVYVVVFFGGNLFLKEERVSEMRMWAGIDCQTVGARNLKESRPEYFVFAPETERKEPFVTGSGEWEG